MNLLVVVLIVLLLVGVPGGWYVGGPYGPHLGSGVGLLLLILIILALTGRL